MGRGCIQKMKYVYCGYSILQDSSAWTQVLIIHHQHSWQLRGVPQAFRRDLANKPYRPLPSAHRVPDLTLCPNRGIAPSLTGGFSQHCESHPRWWFIRGEWFPTTNLFHIQSEMSAHLNPAPSEPHSFHIPSSSSSYMLNKSYSSISSKIYYYLLA